MARRSSQNSRFGRPYRLLDGLGIRNIICLHRPYSRTLGHTRCSPMIGAGQDCRRPRRVPVQVRHGGAAAGPALVAEVRRRPGTPEMSRKRGCRPVPVTRGVGNPEGPQQGRLQRASSIAKPSEINKSNPKPHNLTKLRCLTYLPDEYILLTPCPAIKYNPSAVTPG